MNENKRRHVRIELPARVRLVHPDIGEVVLKTRDVSDSGVYIICDNPGLLPVGSVVKMQVISDDVEMPVVGAKIVRNDSEGIGMEFEDQ
jgi:hypothetical protein